MIEGSYSSRIKWIDQAKGIGIILVMIGHTYLDDKFIFWFTSFHMALFFFLSGCTFKYKEGFVNFLISKIKSLLIPYVFFVFVTLSWNCFSAVSHGNNYIVFDNLLLYLIQCRFTHLWFLTCLFISEIMFYLLYKLTLSFERKIFILIFISIVCLIIEFIYRFLFNISIFWNIDLVPMAVSFMIIGYSMKDKISNIKISFGIISFISSLLISFINYCEYGKVDWWGNSFGNPLFFVISAFTGTVAICILCDKITSKILIYLGRYSIIFYGLHRIIIDATFVIYNKLNIEIVSGTWESLFFAIISVIIAIICIYPVSYFINNYFPWILGKKLHKR